MKIALLGKLILLANTKQVTKERWRISFDFLETKSKNTGVFKMLRHVKVPGWPKLMGSLVVKINRELDYSPTHRPV